MRRSSILRLAILAAVLAFPVARAAAQEDATVKLWKSKCASCHGPDGKGRTLMGKKMSIGDMTSADWQKKRTDDQMRKTVRDGMEDGAKKMKPFKDGLKPEEIDALIAHVRAFGGK